MSTCSFFLRQKTVFEPKIYLMNEIKYISHDFDIKASHISLNKLCGSRYLFIFIIYKKLHTPLEILIRFLIAEFFFL